MAASVTGLERIYLCTRVEGENPLQETDVAAGEWEEHQECGALRTMEEEWPAASHATEGK